MLGLPALAPAPAPLAPLAPWLSEPPATPALPAPELAPAVACGSPATPAFEPLAPAPAAADPASLAEPHAANEPAISSGSSSAAGERRDIAIMGSKGRIRRFRAAARAPLLRLTFNWPSCRLAGMARTIRRAAVTSPSLKEFAKAAESYVELTFARFPS